MNELIDNIDDKGGEEKFREYVKDDKNRGIVFSNNVKIEVLSSKEPEKSTIQGQIPTGCSKVSISDDITNKSIPSASVQLVNKDNKYSGLAKVNAYIDVPGYSTIFLPDWNSNGAKGITNLVYPFNLNTSSALKELAKIPSSKINQATLTINV
ncbi:MAG TPA: hypothetical protein P5241_03075 [Candidatus Paceibacterota bacterium]|nr:hypothetical protein [Bacteroidales bacterium]HRV32497.1 hypothetical protein [Candidatus Paceibacterota bacterium]